MKTSDKILICSTLSVVGILLTLELLHYIKYRKGETLGFKDIERLDFVSREDTGIHWLVLDGPMRTTFYPDGLSDRLKIGVDRSRASEIRYLRHGDTLELLMDSRHYHVRSAYDNWFSYGDYLAVHVFFPPLRGIRIRNGFVTLNNEECHTGIGAALELDSTQCWLGRYDPQHDSATYTEPWDTVSVRSINSNFIINRQVHVKALDLRLDNKSEVSDRFSLIDTAYIRGDSTANLMLRGRNFGRIHLDHVVHSAP
ncbi:MAG TPA: hypothetical protein VG605_08145 [Puia sp.]|nr:hypothetical protein [Puia sp.]